MLSRVDRLLRGRLVLEQPIGGHRAGTDAVLLAAAAAAEAGDMFIDVGAGVGTVGLAVALAEPDCRGILLEADPDLAAMARRNVEANGLAGRVSVVTADLFDREALAAAGLLGTASLVVSNPPFFQPGEVRMSPDAGKAMAHVMAAVEGRDHAAWIGQCLRLSQDKARLLVIHRAEVLGSLLGAFGQRCGGVAVRSIHPRLGNRATRILVGGTVGSRAPLGLLPPLMLHEPGGAFTPEAAALHDGAAIVFWPKRKPARKGPVSSFAIDAGDQ